MSKDDQTVKASLSGMSVDLSGMSVLRRQSQRLEHDVFVPGPCGWFDFTIRCANTCVSREMHLDGNLLHQRTWQNMRWVSLNDCCSELYEPLY